MRASSLQQRKIAIKNVRVFDGNDFGNLTSVTIVDGTITQNEDPSVNDEPPLTIDGEGGYLLPGFIDAHIHLNTKRELRMMAQCGITTGLDMATWPMSKIEELRQVEGLTDFRSPGVPATSPGSVHSIMLPIPRHELVSNPADSARFVADRVAEDADYIKMIADIPGPDLATLTSLVVEAHEHRKQVITHASSYKPFQMAQESGADVITHVPCDKTLSTEDCEQMVKMRRVSVPTLVMMEAVTNPMSWKGILFGLLRPFTLLSLVYAKRKGRSNNEKPHYNHARRSVMALHSYGVPILAGTDAHAEHSSPFSVTHGDSFHRELELLVDAGLSTLEAVRAGTMLPAQYFQLGDRGSISNGKRADLVLLEHNPLRDIQATRSIKRVWCAGTEVDLSSG